MSESGAKSRTLSARASIGGAVGLLLLSRVIGLGRESAVVGLVGVHDYTDAYFAMSAVVGWLQNWSYGALSLSFVPKYLRLPGEERHAWVTRRIKVAAVWGVGLGALFVAAYRPLERVMLSGRNVLGMPEVVLLAICIPATAVGGVQWGVAISYPRGIMASARALVVANASGVLALLGVVALSARPSAALPATLVVTQLVTLVLLVLEARALQREDLGTEGAPVGERASDAAQVAATTIENVGFNASALMQQVIAGGLAPGAITLNAYANRLVLGPLIGLMQPVQQRLLIKFSSESKERSLRALRYAVRISMTMGAVLGLVLLVAGHLAAPVLGPRWQTAFSEHRYPLVLAAYALQAGVVFTNQSVARMFFANGRGVLYAGVMLVAYVGENLIRLSAASYWGLLALPIGALVAEGAAAVVLLRACGSGATSVRADGVHV